MARPNKIDQLNLAEDVLELALTKTSREISAILKAKHGVDVSHVAVARYIQGMRKERAEATKAVVQEHIRATVPTDLQTLDQIIAQEVDWFKSVDLDIAAKLAVAKELRQTIDTKLKYSGAGGGEPEITVKLYDFDADGYPDPEDE